MASTPLSGPSAVRSRGLARSPLRSPPQAKAPHVPRQARAALGADGHRSGRSRCAVGGQSRPGTFGADPLPSFRPAPRHPPPPCAQASQGGFMAAFTAFSEWYSLLFPLWLAGGAVAAVMQPATFSWLTTKYFTAGLAILMFSMGVTLTFDDFKRVLQKPGPVALNFAACYGIMPILGYALGKAFGLSTAFVAGLVLVGATNGGQASNLCTYIARGDVALSVLMTTSTTLGCIVMTPLICKLALGAVIPVDAIGISISTVQVVLLPIILGASLNQIAFKTMRKIEPFCPVVGVTSTIVLVGAAVAQCAEPILNAGLPLQIVCMLLHLVGGIAGYAACRLFNCSEKTSRTTAIETAMKSSAFSFLLASLHFGEYMVRVPAAVSVVWMAIMGATLAVFWRGKPTEAEVA
ncbi:unnamed protein product [Ostreobium quekettii]|uniref:Uncharacterized protein n=1 Tax=Ostreobium quekettii TaxID=121088 RepID=A0A8S1IQ77_9CHLO|nr:unnamed protein product [Ostreobium quekettii]|eukprot:evm.model.scf_743EXC.3 EVM.evm.TU.scf_743EXC.3   scf_743EXC:31310-35122(-)